MLGKMEGTRMDVGQSGTNASVQEELKTADDLLAMPDSKLYELVRGVIVSRPLSSFEASVVAVNVMFAVRSFAEPRKLGTMTGADGGYILERDPDTVRVIDFAFVRSERMPPREKRNHYLELAPDLAVEVVSPSDSASLVQEKINEYLIAGCRLIWIVYPRSRVVTVFADDRAGRILTDVDTLDGGDVLPGFSLPVAEIFA